MINPAGEPVLIQGEVFPSVAIFQAGDAVDSDGKRHNVLRVLAADFAQDTEVRLVLTEAAVERLSLALESILDDWVNCDF